MAGVVHDSTPLVQRRRDLAARRTGIVGLIDLRITGTHQPAPDLVLVRSIGLPFVPLPCPFVGGDTDPAPKPVLCGCRQGFIMDAALDLGIDLRRRSCGEAADQDIGIIIRTGKLGIGGIRGTVLAGINIR